MIAASEAQQLAEEFIQRDHFEVVSFLGSTHVSDALRQAEIGLALGHGDYLLTFTVRRKAADSQSASVSEYVVRVNDVTGECTQFWSL